MFRSIWAEDGWIPLCAKAKGHGSCLGEPVNGYWPIAHRLIAEPIALIDLPLWPYVFPVLGAFALSALSAVIFYVVGRLTSFFWGCVLAFGVVLTPVLGVEFLNVLGNIHWILLASAMLVLAGSYPLKRNGLLIAVFLFIAAVSSPAGFIIPAMIMLLVVTRLSILRGVAWPFFFSLVGWVIQVLAVVKFDGGQRIGSSLSMVERIDGWANSIVGTVPGLSVGRVGPQSFLFVSSRLTPTLIVVLTLITLGLIALHSKSTEVQRRFCVIGIGTQALNAFLLLILDENPRYTFVLVALNLVWIVGLVGSLVGSRFYLRAVLVFLIIVAPLSGFKSGSYRDTPSSITWQEQLESAQAQCRAGAEEVELFFAPGRTYATEVPCSAL